MQEAQPKSFIKDVNPNNKQGKKVLQEQISRPSGPEDGGWTTLAGLWLEAGALLHLHGPAHSTGRTAHHCPTAGAAKSCNYSSVPSVRWDSPPALTCATAETTGKADGKTPGGLFQKACGKTSGNRLSVGSRRQIHSNKRSQKDLVEKNEKPFPPQFW